MSGGLVGSDVPLADRFDLTVLESLPADRLRQEIATAIDGMLLDEDTPISGLERRMLVRDIQNEMVGFGPLELLMADPAASTVSASHLGLQAQRPASGSVDALSLEEAERVFIEKVLARHGGDVRLAAQQLGMSRSALYRRLQQYGVRE